MGEVVWLLEKAKLKSTFSPPPLMLIELFLDEACWKTCAKWS